MMRAHLDAADGTALARTAHAFKGSSGALGATELAEVCAAVEAAAGAGSDEAMGELLARAHTLFTEALRELEGWVARTPSR